MCSRILLSIVLALPLAAQSQAPASPNPNQTPGPPIKVQVNEVIVPITVTDEKGRFEIGRAHV